MEYYIEQGKSYEDCYLKIAERFNNKPFKILSHKKIELKGGFLGLFPKPGVEVEWYFTPSYKKPIVVDAEEKRKLLEAANRSYDNAAAGGKEASDQILSALNELKDKLDANTGKGKEHPSFAKAVNLLRLNDFSDSYINTMIERMKKELSLETLEDFDVVQDHLLEWIGESISIYKQNDDEIGHKPRIFVLIGPTGVGKTSTIAKLAAYYGIKREDFSAFDVRMITIDALRICAYEQLERMGNLMHIPVSLINAEKPELTQQALRREIAVHKETDMFFIDTFGSSPKAASMIGEMKTILDGAGRAAEFHLAVSAATKTSDLDNILRQFEPFNYKSIVLTKMDETEHIGNIIAALADKRKSISYITTGQTIPSDIKKASVVQFLINLDGFKVNREKIEKRFPPGDAIEFRWK